MLITKNITLQHATSQREDTTKGSEFPNMTIDIRMYIHTDVHIWCDTEQTAH